MTAHRPKVFVSYAHESADHMAQVHALATFLVEAGVDVVLDEWWTGTRRDWCAWATKEMTGADFVLVVASRRYRAIGDGSGPSTGNRGVQCEAALLRELIYSDRATWTRKILPVVLPGHTVDQIPLFLQPYTASHFRVASLDATGVARLLRVLEGRPGPAAVRLHEETRPIGKIVRFAAAATAVVGLLVAAALIYLPDDATAAGFTRVQEFTPPPAADPDPCRADQLCAYRGAVSESAQFDLPVTDDLIDICMTVRAGDPGFDTLVAGSTRHIDLYPGRRCTGTPEVAIQAPTNSMRFHFFAYVVRS